MALRLAQEADLDLVEVAPNSKPPVVKVMDYGKFKYEAAQKAKEARRNQANTILKEVRFRLKIDKHDYETKRKRAEGFLQAGDKVKAMILFRGREQSRPEMGVRLLQRFAEEVSEFGAVESTPTIDGRNMVMIIGPHKNKADAKAEQNAARAQAKAARKADEAAPSTDADEDVATETVAEAPAEVLPAEFVKAPAAARKAAPPVAAPAAEAATDGTAPEAAPAEEKPAAKPATSKPASSKPAAKSTPKPAVGKPPLKPTPKNAPTPRTPAAPKTPAPSAE